MAGSDKALLALQTQRKTAIGGKRTFPAGLQGIMRCQPKRSYEPLETNDCDADEADVSSSGANVGLRFCEWLF